MRIERNKGPRRFWGLFPRRWHELQISLELPSVEALFSAPATDPFSDHYEFYGDRPALDAIVAEMGSGTIPSVVRATIALPSTELDPSLEKRTREAVARYCNVKLDAIDVELRKTNRLGWRSLVIGFLAVIVLNAASRQLEDASDEILYSIGQGLSVISWVTLWFPINLLLYDRWYYRRDRKVYQTLREAQITLKGLSGNPGAGETRA